MQFEVTSTLDISISENCATNRGVRVRLVRTVSSGHLSKEYTHKSMCMCVKMQFCDCVCTYICTSAKYSRRAYRTGRKQKGTKLAKEDIYEYLKHNEKILIRGDT